MTTAKILVVDDDTRVRQTIVSLGAGAWLLRH